MSSARFLLGLSCLVLPLGAACDGSLNDSVYEMEGTMHLHANGTAATMDGFDGTDLRRQLAGHDVSEDWSSWQSWDAIRLDTMTLHSDEPVGEIESIDVYTSLGDAEPVLIADVEDVDPGALDIELEIEDVDLAPYILDDSSKIIVEVRAAKAPKPRDFVVTSNLRVDWGDDTSCDNLGDLR